MTDNNYMKEVTKILTHDRKKDRLWKNIRFFSTIIIIAFLYFNVTASHKKTPVDMPPHVAIIQMKGAISPRTSFSAKRIIPELNAAFRDKKAKGVALIINSGGGLATESIVIYDKIMQLKKKYKKKVVVISQNGLASGAYLIACAADKIYVGPATPTGSIGVITASFGFANAIKKLGISRRIFTAGANKSTTDSFMPLTPKAKANVLQRLKQIHNLFINIVKTGRGKHLNGNPKNIFSGQYWLGQQAVKLGLVDGVDNTWTVLQKEFGTQRVFNYTRKPSILDEILKGASTELQSDISLEPNQQYMLVNPNL